MDDLEGRVHGQHRHTHIQHLDAAVCHILGNGAAAAQIQTTHLADLPCHVVGIQHPGDVAQQLGVGVAGRALAAAAGVLEDGNAAAGVGAVLLLKGACPRGVVGSGHVRRQAHAVTEGEDVVLTGSTAEQLHKVEHIHTLHTGHAVRTDLFLIGQHADGGVHGVLGLDLSQQCGVSIHAVIVAVGTDHGAVKAHVACLGSGHHLDLGAGEVALGDAVLLVQQDEGVQLDSLLDVLFLHGIRADEHVQLLALDALAELALVLLSTQMGQQVGDAEHGIVLVLTDGKVDAGAVGAGKHAVDGQRDGSPLVLAYTAVVVGAEVAHVVRLVQRVGTQVQTGAVDVGDDQTEALFIGLLADGSRHNSLVLLNEVDLLAGGVGLFGLKSLVAGSQQHLLADNGSLALGLGAVHKFLVALGKGSSLFLYVCLLVGSVFGGVEQLFGVLFCSKFFAHDFSLLNFLSLTCVQTLIGLVAGGDLVDVVVHLVIGETLQRFPVCGVLLYLQQLIHRAPAAVVSRCRRGYIPFVAHHAKVQVVAPKADGGIGVVQVGKGQRFLRGNFAAHPEKGFLGHLHQAPGIHAGGSLRVEAAFGADKGVDQQRIQLIGCCPFFHQLLVLAGVQKLLCPVAQRRHHAHRKHHCQAQSDQPPHHPAAALLFTKALFFPRRAALPGGDGVVGFFIILFVQSAAVTPPSACSRSHRRAAAACSASNPASLCRV